MTVTEWAPTMNLRWLRIPTIHRTSSKLQLQQAWQRQTFENTAATKGAEVLKNTETEWRPLEVVDYAEPIT